MWAKRSRRSIWPSYVYRVFRLIDFELRVTRPKTRYLWNSGNVWRGPLSICPCRLITRRFALPGKKWETLSFSLSRSAFLTSKSQGRRAIPANSQEGRLIYGGSSSSPLSSAEFREAATRPSLDPFSVAHSRVPYSFAHCRKRFLPFLPFPLFFHP